MATKEEPFESTMRLRKSLFIYLATALFTLTLALMVVIFIILFGHLKNAEDQSLCHNAQIRAMAVMEWNRRAKDLARQITSRTSIRQALEKYNRGEESLAELKKFTIPRLKDAMNLSEDICGIMRLDTKNNRVAECGDCPRCAVAVEDLGVFVNDKLTIFECCEEEGDVLIVSAPIKSRETERAGTDLVFIRMDALKEIIAKQSGFKADGIVIGYRKDGDVLTLTHDEGGHEIMPELRGLMEKAIDGGSGLEYINDTIVSYTHIEDSRWGLIITQSERKLYSPVYDKMVVVGGVSFLLYLAILFGFWQLMKPLAGRMLLCVDELEEKIREKTIDLENEIKERKRAEEEKAETIKDLQEAIKKIHTLQKMLPICSYCKKVRDDKGYWNQIEVYIRDHSDIDFSHSLCPECAAKYYPQFRYDKSGEEE